MTNEDKKEDEERTLKGSEGEAEEIKDEDTQDDTSNEENKANTDDQNDNFKQPMEPSGSTLAAAVAETSGGSMEDLGNQPPMISNSTANFSLASINEHIICTLCNGYFRDPYTITDCLHAFCKSCLFFAFQSGFRKCPKCDKSLEPDPYKEILSDRTLGELVHKILPTLKEKDDSDEVLFYERRGIKRKREFRKDDKQGGKKRLANEKAEKEKREKKLQRYKKVSEVLCETL